jgi:predicted N-acyltransferase
MAYTCRLFTSIDNVDLAAWERVRSESGASIFMDPRFVGVVELSMKHSCRFWHVIIYDDDDRPVACASLTATTVDLADFADPRLASLIRRLPGVLSRFRNLKVFFCGLPGSPAEKALAVALPHASPQILSVLDKAICDLAARTRTDGVFYREFGQDDLKWTNALLDLGYTRVMTPPTHFFKPAFQDLQHYCAALKSHYRKQIRRSIRKLERMGVETTVLTDPAEILRVYTPDVHELYYQVVARADLKQEVLPVEFFHQLSLRLKDEVELIVLSMGARVVAVAWCLQAESTYHMMYGGVDYELNADLDLYFNLVYAALDRALRKQVSRIHVGQTANAFKARIGCYSEPLYVFTKGLGPLMSRVVHYGARLLVAQKPVIPPFDIFKNDAVEPPETRQLEEPPV